MFKSKVSSVKKQRKGKELRGYITRKGLFVNFPIFPELRNSEPEITLGRAVLDRALLDVLEDDHRDTALAWFDLNNTDFTLICFISNIDPFFVLVKVHQTLILLESQHNIEKTKIEDLRDE